MSSESEESGRESPEEIVPEEVDGYVFEPEYPDGETPSETEYESSGSSSEEEDALIDQGSCRTRGASTPRYGRDGTFTRQTTTRYSRHAATVCDTYLWHAAILCEYSGRLFLPHESRSTRSMDLYKNRMHLIIWRENSNPARQRK
jgi:hypothetical protein